MQQNFSVLSSFALQHLFSNGIALKTLSQEYGLEYMISGSLQFDVAKVRVSVSLLDVKSENQIWFRIYELQYSKLDYFELQDRCR